MGNHSVAKVIEIVGTSDERWPKPPTPPFASRVT